MIDRHSAIGLAGAAAFLAVVALCVATYAQVLTRSVPVTVQADRSGLLMDPGAMVKLNGVVVGRVSSVRTNGDGAELGLALDAGLVAHIPSDVAVHIVPPTLFGAKYVRLLVAPIDTAAPIAAGAVIDRSRVTVELNDTFAHAVQTLDAMPAVSLNAALGAAAGILDGRGEQLGRTLVDLNTYLRGFNPSLPALAADLPPIVATTDLYADVTPPLADTIRDGGAVSDTLVRRRDSLAALLVGLDRVSADSADLLRDTEDGLAGTVSRYAPTARLLARYSTALPCVLGGLTRNASLMRVVMGSAARNANLLVNLGAGREAYRYPRDLPIIAEAGPPSCYGLPSVPGIVPFQRFDTGADPLPVRHDSFAIGHPPGGLALEGTGNSSTGGNR
ncbi:MCE family protein [Pseudonocardia eucalypti]|uniref:MCE family protein n=1 Tax=Pseudonocardia eucalypti TaxID=648755 RepID=A0ABP9QJR8_9PSEU|nr:phospholipid/cholesterol/gamma-HCH transport system substrate-binding protein [Pseudonocardia eucalypti]